MPFPDILETATRHLFSDRERMEAARLPAATIAHIERLRGVYSYWLERPSLTDAAIVDELKKRGGIGTTMARRDLRIIKTLLGEFNKVTRDWQRYRFGVMIEKAYQVAESKNDVRGMVAAADKYARYARLDAPDAETIDYRTMITQSFQFTDDPTAAGFERVPNFREKIRKAKEKYWIDAAEDVSFEEIDFSVDDLFKAPDEEERPELT